MSSSKRSGDVLSIGGLAKRTGLAITAIRFYESKALIKPSRNSGGQRRYTRSDIRRLSFIRISQSLGFSLAEIHKVLATLPDSRTPSKRDWERLSRVFKVDIDERIERLTLLSEKLDGCIGCGCLSLAKCRLYNPNDAAAKLGSGPRYLLGDDLSDLDH